MKSQSSESGRAETAKLLKRARESCGLSQGDVARRTGLKGGQFISNIERNRSPIPLKLLVSFVKIYKMDPRKVISAWLADEKTKLNRALLK